eukprot:gene18361-24832_t
MSIAEDIIGSETYSSSGARSGTASRSGSRPVSCRTSEAGGAIPYQPSPSFRSLLPEVLTHFTASGADIMDQAGEGCASGLTSEAGLSPLTISPAPLRILSPGTKEDLRVFHRYLSQSGHCGKEAELFESERIRQTSEKLPYLPSTVSSQLSTLSQLGKEQHRHSAYTIKPSSAATCSIPGAPRHSSSPEQTSFGFDKEVPGKEVAEAEKKPSKSQPELLLSHPSTPKCLLDHHAALVSPSTSSEGNSRTSLTTVQVCEKNNPSLLTSYQSSRKLRVDPVGFRSPTLSSPTVSKVDSPLSSVAPSYNLVQLADAWPTAALKELETSRKHPEEGSKHRRFFSISGSISGLPNPSENTMFSNELAPRRRLTDAANPPTSHQTISCDLWAPLTASYSWTSSTYQHCGENLIAGLPSAEHNASSPLPRASHSEMDDLPLFRLACLHSTYSPRGSSSGSPLLNTSSRQQGVAGSKSPPVTSLKPCSQSISGRLEPLPRQADRPPLTMRLKGRTVSDKGPSMKVALADEHARHALRVGGHSTPINLAESAGLKQNDEVATPRRSAWGELEAQDDSLAAAPECANAVFSFSKRSGGSPMPSLGDFSAVDVGDATKQATGIFNKREADSASQAKSENWQRSLSGQSHMEFDLPQEDSPEEERREQLELGTSVTSFSSVTSPHVDAAHVWDDDSLCETGYVSSNASEFGSVSCDIADLYGHPSAITLMHPVTGYVSSNSSHVGSFLVEIEAGYVARNASDVGSVSGEIEAGYVSSNVSDVGSVSGEIAEMCELPQAMTVMRQETGYVSSNASDVGNVSGDIADIYELPSAITLMRPEAMANLRYTDNDDQQPARRLSSMASKELYDGDPSGRQLVTRRGPAASEPSGHVAASEAPLAGIDSRVIVFAEQHPGMPPLTSSLESLTSSNNRSPAALLSQAPSSSSSYSGWVRQIRDKFKASKQRTSATGSVVSEDSVASVNK